MNNQKQNHTRWGSWENQVLDKCGDLPTLQDVISSRRREIDDDDDQAGLIRETLHKYLRDKGHDPAKSYVKIKVRDLYHLLRFEFPHLSSANRVKAFVGQAGVTELTHKKLNDAAYFVYRGPDAKPDAQLIAYGSREKN